MDSMNRLHETEKTSRILDKKQRNVDFGASFWRGTSLERREYLRRGARSMVTDPVADSPEGSVAVIVKLS